MRRTPDADAAPRGAASLRVAPPAELAQWVADWRSRLAREPRSRQQRPRSMRAANPAYHSPQPSRRGGDRGGDRAGGLRAVQGDAGSLVAALRGAARPRGLSGAAAARGAGAADLLRHLTSLSAPTDSAASLVAGSYRAAGAARRRSVARRNRCAHRRGRIYGPVCGARDGGGGPRHSRAGGGPPGRGVLGPQRRPDRLQLQALVRRSSSALHGAARAFAICREGFEAMDYLRSAVRAGVDCDWRECGCFFGAHTPRHFELMARDARNQPAGLEQRITVVAEERAAPGDRERFLSRRLRLPRRRLGGSDEAAARPFGARARAPAPRCWTDARPRPSDARRADSRCRLPGA